MSTSLYGQPGWRRTTASRFTRSRFAPPSTMPKATMMIALCWRKSAGTLTT